ncbi:uncharacterized protein K460DRAFT_356900 [Cucurbitaria berberidis CBS 394.84]|uniref:CFEM domain-containing protein n=1 Tax=Cucurbitaria berberidis CBS 394.84 TaxID=1168544 RepID=A0A9P4GC36_9PLEO|nr:uncharacterized protein K460DRAFT_356900 [Cucurbitaria berberidis CBS 394.84]KAF1843133.1 hypothetical protein K460DRAFT_356900 [Cucurbitaria berberidis CBS 394.84]
MRFPVITATLTLTVSSLATAQLTFNITQAFTPGNWEKYRCLDNAKLSLWLPSCLSECQKKANAEDGCAFDDFACHCVNYNAYSDLIEPCAFPASQGGQGNCTLAELGQARPIIADMCNFFNATVYGDYHGCAQWVTKEKTYQVIAGEEVIVTH